MRCDPKRNCMRLLIGVVALLGVAVSWAQDATEEAIQTDIQVDAAQPGDDEIARRIDAIFAQLPALRQVEVSVGAGVVQLRGVTPDAADARRAENLVARVDGVVAIENNIERDVSLDGQFAPALKESRALLDHLIALMPSIAMAILIFVAVVLAGVFLSRRKAFWQRITPNAFIAELAATTLRFVFGVVALVLALNLLGATALLSAVLGSAGVIGLAVGFAVRDTIENYVSSIMLSLRQPFRPKDHVVINGQEGRVIRLTSRATVLMTLEGNHLRIPNAEVFKATILNYTSNPERRFDFSLGVDANDDPLAAIQTGIDALCELDFILEEPEPRGIVREVGDSNIVIDYAAWIDQRQADWGKTRSIALSVVKNALESAGFGLPEPIYRLRFDGAPPSITGEVQETSSSAAERESSASPAVRPDLDIAPDRHIEEKMEAERHHGEERDLLNDDAPVE